MTEKDNKLLDHEYDGIREEDNRMPGWWRLLFALSILWAVGYMLYYHVLDIGYSQIDEYRQEINPNYVRVKSADAKLLGLLPQYRSPYYNPAQKTPRLIALASHKGGPRVLMTRENDTTDYVAVTDPKLIAEGQKTFVANCAQCHGQLGEGGVGPNLTDQYWLHGADFNSLVKSVKYGYPSKGMIPWRGTLAEEAIINVASYVQTLRGTNPPNPKAPQGDLVDYEANP